MWRVNTHPKYATPNVGLTGCIYNYIHDNQRPHKCTVTKRGKPGSTHSVVNEVMAPHSGGSVPLSLFVLRSLRHLRRVRTSPQIAWHLPACN
jgi:hypothetical protein